MNPVIKIVLSTVEDFLEVGTSTHKAFVKKFYFKYNWDDEETATETCLDDSDSDLTN